MTLLRSACSCVMLCLLGLVCRAGGQLAREADPNYIYAAVLGSGFYQVEDATLTVVRMPFSKMLREESDDQAGWRLLVPVTVGYASLDPEDPIDRWLPTEIGTMSFVPGIEYRRRIGDRLLLKPFVQSGGGYDFKNQILSGLLVGGTRVLWTSSRETGWRTQVGSSLQWAAEWAEGGGGRSSFGLFEIGADFRHDLPWCIAGQRLSGSIYGRWRHFFNDWNVAATPIDPIQVDNLYEVGVSLEVENGVDLFGYDFRRVSLGWVTGQDVNAFTLGTTFPF